MNYFILGFSWICHHVKNSLMYVIPLIANCNHLKNPKKIFNEYIYIVRGVIQCTESKYVCGIFIACSFLLLLAVHVSDKLEVEICAHFSSSDNYSMHK